MRFLFYRETYWDFKFNFNFNFNIETWTLRGRFLILLSLSSLVKKTIKCVDFSKFILLPGNLIT